MTSYLSKTIITQSKHLENEKKYWSTKLAGAFVRTYFPYDYIAPHLSTSQKQNFQFEISGDLFSRLNQLSKGSDNNLFIILLTCLAVLLNKYTGNKDIITSVPIYKQESEGEFINTALPVRIQLTGQETMKELLILCKNTVFESNEYLNFPIERLINDHQELSLPGDGTDLFEIGILLENIHYKKYIEHLNHNILFTFLKERNEIKGFIEYNPCLYKKDTIKAIGEHFVSLLEIILKNLNLRVFDIEILSVEEKYRLLIDFNKTERTVPRDKTIMDIFAEQVKKRGENIILRDGSQVSMQYEDLNNKSNQLGRFLKEKGVRADTSVAVMTVPSVQTVIGILAILKAGGTYLPIDPEFPVGRINYMLMDSQARMLLTQDHAIEKPMTACELININDNRIYTENASNLQEKNSPRDSIYMIYTSGTSGRPKGVLIKNENLVNYVYWFLEVAGLTENDKTMLLSSFAFDLGYTSVYSSLLAGAELHLIPKEIFLIPEKLLDYIKEKGITYLKLTPSLFSIIVNNSNFSKEKCASLRLVVLGGEPINVQDLAHANSLCPHLQIMNHYGPTEATIGSIARFIDFNRFEEYKQIPTLGKPINNTDIYILDENLKPLPVCIPAELCIGGYGVGRGYLNQPELTACKFTAHPFKKESRLYRTGDKARWTPDGDIEFLGRIDTQIKIRGFRIELEEIENQLRKQESIKSAVVIARQDDRRGMYLCAYYISSNAVESAQLREDLASKLPFYMIPSFFIELKKIPVTPNGKVDHRALPEPANETEGTFLSPKDEQQEKLAVLWSSVLGIEKEKISIDANFFELGGDSLKATTLIAKIHKACNFQIPLIELFKSPTLIGISEIINKSIEDKFSSIEAVEEKEFYPASSTQKRIYILQQIETQSTFYNVPSLLSIEGEVEEKRFSEVFEKLISRHAALRTSFFMADEELMQRIHKEVEFSIQNFEALPGKQEGEDVVKNFIRPFDLARAPLMRVGLIKTGEKKYLFYIDMHHIIRDATTIQILNNEFMALYKGEELLPLKLHYKDFSQWQNSRRMQGILNAQKKYWQQEFFDEIPVLNLPTDYPRPANQSFEGNTIFFEINEKETILLNEIARSERTTLFMLLLSLFYVFLCKISSQEDIVVGTPIASRTHADLGRIIGMLLNTLAIRNIIPLQGNFKEFLSDVKNKTLKAYDNQDYPFEDLVENVLIKRDLSRNPMFDVMFVLHNVNDEPDNVSSRKVKNLNISGYPFESKTSKFDLTLFSIERRGKLCFSIEYCTKLFREETVLRFSEYFKKIISSVIEYPEKIIADIEVIPAEEKHRLLFEFNDTEVDYPKEKTIHRLFGEQVENSPDNIAVIGPSVLAIPEMFLQTTYKELNEESNRAAYTLLERGIKSDTIVGIMMERSVEMIIGILGILKAGGAYLPIDPGYPQERVNYMLKDSGAIVLVTSNDLEKLPNIPTSQLPNFHLSPAASLAYIIYTSGSTGKPKGVAIQHFSLVNRLNWMQKKYPINHNDTILQKTTFTFDVSVWEILWWSITGAKVHLLLHGGEKELEIITSAVERNHVSVMHFVPSMLNVFLDYIDGNGCGKRLSSLKQVIASGETLTLPLVERFNNILRRINGTALANLYGPTEATIDVSYFDCVEVKEMEIIPIGKPIDNICLYILDKHFHFQPIGVLGELCISGKGLAKGYINQPELTAEKFCLRRPGGSFRENPQRFPLYPRKSFLLHNSLIYRTGDQARWLSNGNIEFLGRIDHQVKIRGFRIELGEIENCLLRIVGVKEAVVAAREENGGDKYICAYYVSASEFEISAVREFLLKELPDYMIPSYFVRLEKIPLTPNGKVDRKALPAPARTTGESYIAPRDEVETKLAEIWSELLVIEKEKIGIASNFFELGGHSLKVTILVAKIHKEFEVRLPLAEIFKAPRIEALATDIKRKGKEIYMSVKSEEKKEYYPLSSAQKRIYILQQMQLESTAYNMPAFIPLEMEPDINKIEETFKKLIARHESLHTSFCMLHDDPVQRIHDDVQFEIVPHHVTVAGEVPILDSFIRPFDLAQAPLLRVVLVAYGGDSTNIKCGNGHALLMVDMHHIISDGVSQGIMINDFLALYEGEELLPLRIQYKDFSQWQKGEKEKDKIKQQERYWLKEFAGEIPVLDLPLDYPRPVEQSFEGNSVKFEITREETQELKAMALKGNSTLFMVLTAVINILLSKLSGQEDIVIGTPIAGRRHADLEKLIGMFVNTISLRSYPAGERTFREFLGDVKEKTLKAFENQEYPFEELVDNLAVKRDMGRNPLFDVMFALHNMDRNSTDLEKNTKKDNGRLSPKDSPNENENSFHTSKFDLEIASIERGGGLFFILHYCTKLFKKETIERYIIYFKKIISITVKESGIKISEIEIISEEEKNRLLYDFNDTEADYPKDKTIHRLFEEQVERTPDNTALHGCMIVWMQGEEGSITYKELNEKSNGLAGLLIENGIQPDTIVGIMIERSVEMIIGILGILKAGGAYLPIDPGYPQERVNYMLKDSGAIVLVTSNDLEKLPNIPTSQHPNFHLSPAASLAYIIYTSGSTGKPKGVMVKHRNVVRLIKNNNYVDFVENQRMLATGALEFDASTFEIWGSLLNNLTLVLVEKNRVLNPSELKKTVNAFFISILWLTSPLFNQLAEAEVEIFTGISFLLVGGDVLSPSHINRVRDRCPGIKILNGYGPTENTTFSTTFLVEKEYKSGIPIGTPISNSTAYIVDRAFHLRPVGVTGELVVGGDGVSRGYLNDPELTAEKFTQDLWAYRDYHDKKNLVVLEGVSCPGLYSIPTAVIHKPFLRATSQPLTINTKVLNQRRQRVYKTGDLARWLSDGNIEFLGRIDQQVKIRGFRIELGEIENCLLRVNGVKETVVLMREETGGDKHICAYFVSDREYGISEIREYLSKELPEYMVPSHFVRLEKIPLTPNSKVDRTALLKEVTYSLKSDLFFVEPKKELEIKIAFIWKELLHKEKVGIYHDFFEIGGNSLKIIQLKNRLTQELNINIPVVAFFQHPTIYSFIEYLTKTEEKNIILSNESDKLEKLERSKRIQKKIREKRRERS